MSKAVSTAAAVNGSQRADLQSGTDGDTATDWPARLAGKEGRKETYAAYLRSGVWKARRIAALERAGDRCQVCNSSKRLQVHHRTYERVGREDPGDLVVLCTRCHRLFHKHGARAKSGSTKKQKKRGKTLTTQEAIMRRLDCGRTYSTAEIAELVGRGKSHTGVALVELKKAERVCRVGKKRWRVNLT